METRESEGESLFLLRPTAFSQSRSGVVFRACPSLSRAELVRGLPRTLGGAEWKLQRELFPDLADPNRYTLLDLGVTRLRDARAITDRMGVYLLGGGVVRKARDRKRRGVAG